jgi:hypothetical protein
VVLGIALHDVLYQRTVIWQKVGSDMDSLSVPDFAVLETVLSRVQYRQKTELCADTEIRDDHVKNLVEELVFGDLLD